MNLNFVKKSVVYTLCCSLFIFSCTSDNVEDNKDKQIIQVNPDVIQENPKSITLDEVLKIEEYVKDQGYDLGNLSLNKTLSNPIQKMYDQNGVNNGLFLKSIKINYEMTMPNTGQIVNCSGVVLVPHNKSKNYRILLSMPPTYTLNSTAPSNFFNNFNLDIFNAKEHETIYLYLLALQAAQGFAVIIPDYPGYGDSQGKLFHPYLVKEIHNKSNLLFLEAAKNKLNNLGYSTKKEILVSGYSQGGFSANHFVRELETNPTNSTKVLALASGAAPTNLLDLINIAKKSTSIEFPLLFPLSYFGFQRNGYLNMPISDLIKEPYATNSQNYFYGTLGVLNINARLGNQPRNLLQNDFINADLKNNLKFKNLANVLEINSLKPWINSCEFRIYHSKEDKTVYIDQATNYITKHNQNGGKVSLHDLPSSHIVSLFTYYIKTMFFLNKYK